MLEQSQTWPDFDFRRTLDSLPLRLYVKDLQGRFQHANQACSQAMGVADQSGLLGKTDLDFFMGDVARKWMEQELEVARGGRAIIDSEEREIWTDGHVTWALTTKIPLCDVTGKVVGVFGVSSDITKRKLELERYRHAVDGARDGFWFHDLIKDEVWFSAQWKEMLGYEAEGFPNNRGEWWSLVYDDDRARVEEERRRHLSGQTEHYRCRYRLRKNDGEYCWVLARGKASKDVDGHRFAGSHTDITDFMETQMLVQSITDATTSLIFVKNSRLQFTFVNRALATAFGKAEQDILGKTDGELNLNKEQVQHFEHDDMTVLRTGQPLSICKEELTYADGSVHVLATKKVPLKLGRSQEPHILGIATDITELETQTRLTKKILEVLLGAIQSIQEASSEEDACEQAVIHLMELDYPDFMISFLRHDNGDDCIVADSRYAATKKWKQIAERTSRSFVPSPDGKLDVLPAVLRRKEAKFVRDSRTDPECDADLSREVQLISQYVVPLYTDKMDIGTLQVDMQDVDAKPEEPCKMIDAVAAHLSLAIDRHRTRSSLDAINTELENRAKLIAFEAVAVRIVHQLNQLINSYMDVLESAEKNRELRSNRPAMDFLKQTRRFVNLWRAELVERFDGFQRDEQPREFDVDSLLAETVSDLQAKALARRCILSGAYNASDVHVFASPNTLREIVTCLIMNAIEANARHVTVRSANVQDSPCENAGSTGRVEIVVTDDGDGIAVENQKRMKEVGWTTKKARGHGLGLPIVEKHVVGLGGRFSLRSGGRSAGEAETVFCINLPTAP